MSKVKTFKVIVASVLLLIAMVLLFPIQIARAGLNIDFAVRKFIAQNFYEGEEAEKIFPSSRYRCVFPARQLEK